MARIIMRLRSSCEESSRSPTSSGTLNDSRDHVAISASLDRKAVIGDSVHYSLLRSRRAGALVILTTNELLFEGKAERLLATEEGPPIQCPEVASHLLGSALPPLNQDPLSFQHPTVRALHRHRKRNTGAYALRDSAEVLELRERPLEMSQ